MRCMILVKATAETEAGVLPSTALLEAMGRFNEELVAAGVLVDGDGLHPSTKGARVRFRGGERVVVDGPFPETKELIAGYWIWKVDSLDEAIEWAKKIPNPTGEESEVEIRPIFEADDFGEALTRDLRAREERMRQGLASRG